MIEVAGGREDAGPEQVRAEIEAFRTVPAIGVFLAAVGLLVLPAVIGLLYLLGVIS